MPLSNWIDDPTAGAPTHVVSWNGSAWILETNPRLDESRLQRVVSGEPRPAIEKRGAIGIVASSDIEGRSGLATRYGLTRTLQRSATDPPAVTRCRTSVEAGPYSPEKLYGFAGDVRCRPCYSARDSRRRSRTGRPAGFTFVFTLAMNWF